MNFLGKLLIIILIGIVVTVYVVMPYINGMSGPYHTVTHIIEKVIIPEERRDDDAWKEQVLQDKDGNVVGKR